MDITTPRAAAAGLRGFPRLSTVFLAFHLIRSSLSIDLLLVALIIRVCSSKSGASEAVEGNVPRSGFVEVGAPKSRENHPEIV